MKYYTEDEISLLRVSKYVINIDIEDSRYFRKHKTVLLWVKMGLSNKEISNETGINKKTVENYILEMLHKIEARNRVELVIKSIQMNIIRLDEEPPVKNIALNKAPGEGRELLKK